MAVPGCVNGRLENPEVYFRSLVAGMPFLNVENAEGVLGSLEPQLTRYWIAVQHDSYGNPRLRLHLPVRGRTPVPGDPDPWHNVDVGNATNTDWAWIDRGGPYTPAPCGEQPPTPPPDDLEARVARLERAVLMLEEDCAALADRVDRHLRP